MIQNTTITAIFRAILILSVALCSSSFYLPGPTPNTQRGEADRYVPNEAFGYGEHLEYRIGYKFITAGHASFDILPNPVMKGSRQCYDIRFEVRSLESLEWLYRVRDRYRTVLDVSGIFPWEFNQSIREGGYSRDFNASLDQINHQAHTNEGDFQISPYIHDIVSAFFYVRTQNLRQFTNGSIINLKNFFNKDCHDLGVRVLGKQTVEVEAGKFRCIVVEPVISDGGLFKSDGRILIWLSDDDRKAPIKVSAKIPIGTIDAELTSFRGLRGELSARLSD